MSDSRNREALEDTLNAPTIAPKCWKTATRVLLELTSSLSVDSYELCQAMTEKHQKFLALEIAKCHLNDMGLDLYQDSEFARENCGPPILSKRQQPSSWDSLFGCLKSLSPVGVNVYTHYVSHVQMLCTRLTRDVVAAYQQETYESLLHQFHDMSQQSINQVDTIRRWMADLELQIGDLADLPAQLRDQVEQEILALWNNSVQEMARGLEESLQDRLNNQLESGTAKILQSLSSQYSSQWEQLVTQMSRQENEQKLLYRKWMSEQAQLFDAQSREITEQRQALAYQREHIANMTALVLDATQKMKPRLSSLEYFIQFAIDGYGWITTALFVLFARNVTWLVTSLSITRYVRPYLLAIVWIEALLEASIRVRSSMEGTSTTDYYQNLLHDVRVLSILLGVATFIVGTFLSIIRFLARQQRPKLPPENATPQLSTGTPQVQQRVYSPSAPLSQQLDTNHQAPLHSSANAVQFHGGLEGVAPPSFISLPAMRDASWQSGGGQIHQELQDAASAGQAYFVRQYVPVAYHRPLVQMQSTTNPQIAPAALDPVSRQGQGAHLASVVSIPAVTPEAVKQPRARCLGTSSMPICPDSTEGSSDTVDEMDADEDEDDDDDAAMDDQAEFSGSRKRERPPSAKEGESGHAEKKPKYDD